MNDHKLTYLKRQLHRMQRLVDSMPDENHDKPRCQSDVNIVKSLIDDVAEIETLRADYDECYQELIETDLKSQGFEAENETLRAAIKQATEYGEVSFLGVNIPFKSFNALKQALEGKSDD